MLIGCSTVQFCQYHDSCNGSISVFTNEVYCHVPHRQEVISVKCCFSCSFTFDQRVLSTIEIITTNKYVLRW